MQKLYTMHKKRKNDFIGRLKERDENDGCHPVVITSGCGWGKIYKKWQEYNEYDAEVCDIPHSICLNHVRLGTDANNRIGKEIINKRCVVSGYFKKGPGVRFEHKDEHAAVALVYDRQSNGETPLYSDVFQQRYNLARIDVNAPLVWENMDNVDRFTILKVQRFHWYDLYQKDNGDQANSVQYCQTATPTKYYFEWDIDLMDLKTEFANTNHDDFHDINSGSLWIMQIARNTEFILDDVTQITLNLMARVYFEDR